MPGDLASMCVKYREKPDSVLYYDIVKECSRIGSRYLRSDFYVPPSPGLISYAPYDGTGMISIDRTVESFSARGRRLDNIISRKRIKEILKTHVAVLYDDSDQMTGVWQSRVLGEQVDEIMTPATLAKIAAITLIESVGRRADNTDVIVYGSDVLGPYNRHQVSYRDILGKNGSGLARLDLALARLLQKEWEMRKGTKYLIMLSGGLPYIGRNILLDDIEVQESVFVYLHRMLRLGVRALYIPFNTDERLLDTWVGGYTLKNFARKMARIGVAVSPVSDIAELPECLREGIKKMMASRHLISSVRR